MSEHLLEVDVAAWVEKAREDPVIYQQRQTNRDGNYRE